MRRESTERTLIFLFIQTCGNQKDVKLSLGH